MNVRNLLLIVLIFSFLTACSNNDDKNDKKDGKGGLTPSGRKSEHTDPAIHIVGEDGTPIIGAQILLGNGLNSPILGNLLTSLDGSIVPPESWTMKLSVTISAPGYLRVTYLAQQPHGQTFVVRKQAVGGSYELKGKVPGVVLSGSRNADVALVIPAFQIQDIFNFKMDNVVSTQKDQITIAGQRFSVPSNVVIPHQNQSYGIIPVTLDKEDYRIYFESSGVKKIFAIQGKFPFSPFVDKIIAGKKFYELVNDFQMLRGGIQDVSVMQSTQSANLTVNQYQFNQLLKTATGPVAPDEIIFGIALAPIQGYMVPTDVKSLTPNSQDQLHVAGSLDAKLLTVLKKKNEASGGSGAERLSVVLLPFSDGMSSESLPVMENPRVMSAGYVQLPKIQSVRGISPVATYATLSEVTTVVHPIWEVYGPEWVESVEIPNWPGEQAPTAPASGKLRWAISLTAGAATHPDLDLGPALIQTVTHVTNSSTDF